VEKKPDLVKIWFIRLPGSKLADQKPIVKATIDESHTHGVRVAVHATQLETARAAVRLGCDILVHSVDDQPVDEEFIRLVKERGVIYTTTLVVFEGYNEVLGQKVELTDVERALGDAEIIASWDELKSMPEEELPGSLRRPRRERSNKVALDNLKKMHDGGVLVAAGTDAGNIGTLHGPSIHRELELMASAGLTPMQVLVCATRNAARVFAKDPGFGILAPGKLADLVILTADPTTDIKNARRIETVVKGGHMIDPASMQKAPEGGRFHR
jgi:imidazolonepropionase-like amidohydrolase